MRTRFALAFLLAGQVAHAAPELAGTLPFTGGIGGLSAIDFRDDGEHFVIASDQGQLILGRVVRDAEQRPISIEHTKTIGFQGAGKDIEGVALWKKLGFASVEGANEILVLNDANEAVARADIDEALHGRGKNSGVEALAVTSSGDLLALEERVQAVAVDLWRYREGVWSAIATVAKPEGYAPVGADMGSDGALYVLLRRFSIMGFASVVLRVDIETGHSQQVWQARSLEGFGNLEGLAVWSDRAGRIRLTMVSDDNQLPLLPSDLVEIVLK